VSLAAPLSVPRLRGAAAGLLVAALVLVGLLLAPAARAETVTGGNGTYTIHISNESGQYTVTTGPSHPLGEGLNVLFGDGSPGTSFDSIKSFTTGHETDLPSLPATVVALGTTGFQTTYQWAEDELEIVQTIQVHGTGFNDSFVEVSTIVKNNSGAPAKVGVRYLWDYQINRDDGPTFQADDPTGPVLFNEASFPGPAFDHYTIEDNDVSPEPPTFDVLGTVQGPAIASPVPPTLLVNASWPASDGTTFDYTPTGESVSVSTTGTNDNAVLYYWGDNEGDAPTIAAGGTFRASASMFLTPPGAGLPGTPPVVRITSGPPLETEANTAAFTFVGVKGGVYECSLDGGPFTRCTSPTSYGPLKPGDHLFQVRESLGGLTGPVASYRWTIDIPKQCILKVARARVFVFTKKSKVRLVIRYTTYKRALVTVGYKLKGSKGSLSLGKATKKFQTKGVFKLPVTLKPDKISKVRAAKEFKVHFAIHGTPKLCKQFYTKQLTIPKVVSKQTVWFQSDSLFAPGGLP
jgi:hypothetical protein